MSQRVQENDTATQGACRRVAERMLQRSQEDVATTTSEGYYSNLRSMWLRLKEHVAASSGNVAAIDGGYCSVLRRMLQRCMEDVAAILRRSFQRLKEDAAAI